MKLSNNLVCILAVVTIQYIDARAIKRATPPQEVKKPAEIPAPVIEAAQPPREIIQPIQIIQPMREIKPISYKNLLEDVRTRTDVLTHDGSLTDTFVKKIRDSQLHPDFIEALLEAGVNLHIQLTGDPGQDIMVRTRPAQQINKIMGSIILERSLENPIVQRPQAVQPGIPIQPSKMPKGKEEFNEPLYFEAQNAAKSKLGKYRDALKNIIEKNIALRDPITQRGLELAQELYSEYRELSPENIRDAVLTVIANDPVLWRLISKNSEGYPRLEAAFDPRNWAFAQPQEQPVPKAQPQLSKSQLQVKNSNINALQNLLATTKKTAIASILKEGQHAFDKLLSLPEDHTYLFTMLGRHFYNKHPQLDKEILIETLYQEIGLNRVLQKYVNDTLSQEIINGIGAAYK